MELVLFIGLQGSGKSSFFRERFAATHVHVSKDLWPNARRREARQRRLIAQALAEGRPVVVDNTNPLVEEREPLIAIARERGARVVGYVFESDLKACLERNAGRVGRSRVPEKALHITWRKLKWPSYTEGFDALFHVRLAPEGGFHVREWREGDESKPVRSPDA
ncbi:ATP-binding protein [Archangium lipolyticum]|uniref:ATP-binding protein n=1 Tax=Archangium lipolyticum TaxID=2970465 RepID=UPI0021499CB6|nr:ATP-binding protein [Archangium lipolyticum]